MDKSVRKTVFLIFIATLLAVSLSFIVIGAKNLVDSEEIAVMIEPSKIYEQQGFASVEEWKESFETANRTNVFIGVGLLILAIVIVAVIRRKRLGDPGD